jgi:hypothetical protein
VPDVQRRSVNNLMQETHNGQSHRDGRDRRGGDTDQYGEPTSRSEDQEPPLR